MTSSTATSSPHQGLSDPAAAAACIRAVRGRADVVRRAFSTIERAVLQSSAPGARGAVEHVERCLREVDRRCKARVALGIVGEFGSAKSALTGAQLGDAGLLPTGPGATSGQVTSIRLVAGRPGSRPAVLGRTVRFVDAESVRRLVDFTLRELTRFAAHATRVQVTPPDTLPHPLDDDWAALAPWLRALPWDQPGLHPDLFAAALDLAHIRVALAAGRDLLGRSEPLDEEHLAHALVIGDSREIPPAMPEPTPGVAYRAGETLTPTALRTLYPLVHRVELRVAVDPEVARLLDLDPENEAEILDFPGTNAQGSIRDHFLLVNELPKPIHVLLAATPALRSGTASLTTLHARAQEAGLTDRQIRDLFLVVATKADELIPPHRPVRDTDDLADRATDAPSAAVAGLLAMADTFVGGDLSRLSLHSTDVGVARGGVLPPRDPKEQHDMLDRRPGALHNVDRWAQAVGHVDSADRLAHLLSGLATDGGGAATREMVFGHLRAHGLRNKALAALEADARLHSALRSLRPLLDASVPADLGATERVLNDVRDCAESSLAELDRLFTADDADILLRHAVAEIYAWPDWRGMRRRLRNAAEGVTAGGRQHDDSRRRFTADLNGDSDFDAEFDAEFEAEFDSGFDSGFDAGFDAGFDGGLDAGPPDPAAAGRAVIDTTIPLQALFTRAVDNLTKAVDAEFEADTAQWAGSMADQLADTRAEVLRKETMSQLSRALLGLLLHRERAKVAYGSLRTLVEARWPVRLAGQIRERARTGLTARLPDAFPLPADHTLPWHGAAVAARVAEHAPARTPWRQYQALLAARFTLAQAVAHVVAAYRTRLRADYAAAAAAAVDEWLADIPQPGELAGRAPVPSVPTQTTPLDELLDLWTGRSSSR